GAIKHRNQPVVHMVRERAVMTLDAALARVSKMLGVAMEWTDLRAFLPLDGDPMLRKSALASSFLAALELAKQGKAEIAQDQAFGPLMLRAARA
ncbi:MAG: segregation/condensation protein A, partial [Novosphingobium sp. 35-62-5]